MPLIIYRRWETILNHSFREAGVSVPDYFCVCDDMRTSLAWAESGFGTAIVPASSCGRAGDAGLAVARLADARGTDPSDADTEKGQAAVRSAENFLKCYAERL